MSSIAAPHASALERPYVMHPSTEQMLQHAARADSGADIARHIEQCPECRADFLALGRSLQALAASSGGTSTETSDCLDDASVAALAEGVSPHGERPRLVAHLAGCTACRVRVASVTRAIASAPIAAELARAAAPRARWGGRVAIVTAGLAAAAALVMLVPRPPDDEPAAHRSSPASPAGAPVPTSPLGVVASATHLRWRAVPGADRYRVTIFDREGEVVHELLLADTVLGLPADVELDAGRSYFWKVDARTGWARWTPSELVEFSIPQERRP